LPLESSVPIGHPSDKLSGAFEGYSVIDAATWAQMNGEYAMPADAGPAWRAAHAAGIDMSLIEDSLRLTPEERLAEHQQIIDFLLEVQAAGHSHATE
jgi:hypothetical protein